jgi:hypothetical protein
MRTDPRDRERLKNEVNGERRSTTSASRRQANARTKILQPLLKMRELVILFHEVTSGLKFILTIFRSSRRIFSRPP